MKKMYFAMIPKRSFLESALITVGVGAGLIYGTKFLSGDQKFNEYKGLLKEKLLNSGAPAFSTEAQGPDTGMGIGDEDAHAKDENTILERIRKAAKL